MDGSGAALATLSFGSYGARRGSAWTGAPSAGDWTQIGNSTRQGFTGHEGLDNVNFVHMNERVFEPVLGRFISADPFMPGSLGSQAPNRYAYVGNQPQSLIDPTGFQDRDVTEAQPRPRVFPQCHTRTDLNSVDCPFNFGWLFDIDPYLRWLRQEHMNELWVSWMTANAARAYTWTPPPRANSQPTPAPDLTKNQQSCAAAAPPTLGEANETFRNNNDPEKVITVDASQLTVKQVGPMNTRGNGVVQGADRFVFGTVDLVQDASGTVSIRPNSYSFEPRPVDSFGKLARNIETYFGFYVATYGGMTEYWANLTDGNFATDYMIKFECQPNVVQ
jgi:RHS repeat-associated protein